MTPPIDASDMFSFLHLPQKILVEQIDAWIAACTELCNVAQREGN
jgi:hypothetical protein